MVAAIANDGQRDLFAGFRVPAWHNLGTVFQSEVTESAEMLRLAGLSGWDVRQELVEVPGVTEYVKREYSVVATMPKGKTVLGYTGERYEVVQNEEAFSFLQSLHDGARWETAGAIKGGAVVFGSMAFDRDFVLDPSGVSDEVSSYLLVYTSHDGSTGIAGGVTPTRVVCQNTLNVAVRNAKQTFKIRHTKSADERMKAEAELFRNANVYMDQFEKDAQTLFATAATDKDYFAIVEGFYPKPEADVKGAIKKWESKQEVFAQAWNGSPNRGIQGTAWGVFNALTEANQWGRRTQNTPNGAANFNAAGAGFDGPTNAFRNAAFKAALALV